MKEPDIEEILHQTLANPDSHPEIIIYWDSQDAASARPAYRAPGESGSLNVSGWSHVAGNFVSDDDIQGYNVSQYFGADGLYLGPDQDGIYPEMTQ